MADGHFHGDCRAPRTESRNAAKRYNPHQGPLAALEAGKQSGVFRALWEENECEPAVLVREQNHGVFRVWRAARPTSPADGRTLGCRRLFGQKRKKHRKKWDPGNEK